MKYSCKQENVRESSEIYDQRKWTGAVTLKVIDNVLCKYVDTKNSIEENLREKT